MDMVGVLTGYEGASRFEAVNQTVLHQEVEAPIDTGRGDGGILWQQQVTNFVG